MDLATAFQKYARGDNGQLILKFSETEHLCKISIENGEAVYIKLGNLDVEAILGVITQHEPVEVNFIKGYIPKKRLPEPITDRILGRDNNSVYAKTADGSDEVEVKADYSAGKMISVSRVNKTINIYVDMVGPLGAVMLENILKKLNYTKNTSMPADDFNYMMNELVKDVPQGMRAEFMEAVK